MILNSEPIRKWILTSAWGRKWLLMKDVKGIWYTKLMRGIEQRSTEKCAEQ